MQFDEVLRTFTEFFDHERVRYALVGGLAVAAWGGSRSTKDVDFLVSRTEQNRVVAFTESLGYETLQVTSGFSNHVHPDATLGRVDFMYVDPVTAEKVFGQARPVRVFGDREVTVASPEHVAMMKGLAMKDSPRRALADPEDVRILLSVEGIDRESVRDYYQKIGLLELYDAIERARRTS